MNKTSLCLDVILFNALASSKSTQRIEPTNAADILEVARKVFLFYNSQPFGLIAHDNTSNGIYRVHLHVAR